MTAHLLMSYIAFLFGACLAGISIPYGNRVQRFLGWSFLLCDFLVIVLYVFKF